MIAAGARLLGTDKLVLWLRGEGDVVRREDWGLARGVPGHLPVPGAVYVFNEGVLVG